MESIDNLAREIGYAVLSLPIIALLIWVVARSPLLQWILKITLLVAWGLLTVGATLFVIFAIHLPKSNYGAALAALFVGGFISIFLGVRRFT